MSHGPQASWMEVLAMASYDRGRYSPYAGELQNAAHVLNSMGMPAMGHGAQTSRAEVCAVTIGEHGRWPSKVVNSVVPQRDVAGRGHSPGEFVASHGPLVSMATDE
jgi:hypothetical protein